MYMIMAHLHCIFNPFGILLFVGQDFEGGGQDKVSSFH